jgi:proteasome accessory factor B
MAAARSERLMKLLIMLLVQRRHIGKERIREILYPGQSDEAFNRMFERDKDDLRALGVPVDVSSTDAFFDDEIGYRIKPDDLQLPQIDLTADEAAVIGLATKVWEHARLAEATSQAMTKLVASSEVDLAALDLVSPRLSADEPAFDVLWESALDRTAVEFDYGRPGDQPRTRHLQPWGIVRWSGRWYVVGFDTDREDERVFRLSRIVGEPRRTGAPGGFEVPHGIDLGEVARRLDQPSVQEPAVVLARTGTGYGLRRNAAGIETGVEGPDGTHEWDRLHLSHAGPESAGDLLAYGDDVYVESPLALRDEVIARVEAFLEAAS